MSDEHYLKKELYKLVGSDPAVFEFIQSGSLDGMWYWDLENPENEWMSEQFWKTLGYDPAEKKHLSSEWQDIIFSDDLKVVTDNFYKHCEDPEFPYDQYVRYHHADGHTVWVRCRGVAIRDNNGKPKRMLGAHTDVTDLMQSTAQYESLFENCPNGLILMNPKGQMLKVNDKARKILCVEQDMVLHNIAQFFSADVVKQLFDKTNKLISGEHVDVDQELSLEAEIHRKARRPLDMQISIKQIWYNSQWVFMLSLFDLTIRKQIDRSRTNLISTINHELRSPLTSIMGSVGLIVNDSSDNQEMHKELLQIVLRNCDRLKTTVDDILNIDKIESENFDLDKDTFNLISLIEEVIEEIKGYAIQFDVNLAFVAHPDSIEVHADRFRISQVLTNLITNALKHSPPSSTVEIGAVKRAEGVTINVTDKGTGVSPEFADNLFKRFAQDASDPTPVSVSSSGLGLYICRLIVDEHQGEIGFNNLANGCCFYFSLPYE